ncbi:AAA family ATPase [Stutzerimonas decontaminans]|uniref:AAA family ATPase n=1 Tax=Stutzerimonas decontaminans TaxID=3022791 RepID=A0ABX4VZ49_9GAMM|nr:AAA family ATPase [Stutzerimonas decontaminans]MCQ4247153.1 AAA family ATPase [Stutzerimonas decontaminans]PNF85306.1 AAA family ATPase [Stutzerimonas decontaminans]
MKISELVLHNFRKYDDALLQFNPRFNVLIGNNGKGKTTVLDALAMLLNTYFQGGKLTTGGGTIKASDARAVFSEVEGQVFRQASSEVWLEAEAVVENTPPVRWRRELGDRGGKAKKFVKKGQETRDRVIKSQGDDIDLPLFLYYGAGRLWDKHDDVEIDSPSSRLAGYRYCLDPKSDHKAFEKWFKRLSLASLQKKKDIPALASVTNAVTSCIPGARNFYFDAGYDHLMLELDHEGLVPFDDLSDGYRNMVGIIADIAHRASRLNPHHGTGAAKKTQGIVLIDEIDLHLHPKWQRRVVSDLKGAFPCMQFIVSTHSPFILQSLDAGEVIDLERGLRPAQADSIPDGIAAPASDAKYSNRSIEDIIEEVMKIPVPQRGERFQKMYEAAIEYFRLLNEASGDVTEERKKAIKAKLDDLSSPFSDNVAYHAFLQMKRLVSGIDGTPENGLLGKNA